MFGDKMTDDETIEAVDLQRLSGALIGAVPCDAGDIAIQYSRSHHANLSFWLQDDQSLGLLRKRLV